MTRADSTVDDATALLRVRERIRGRGQAYDGEQSIADVTYLLMDVEEPRDASIRGGETFPSLGAERNVYGRLESADPGALGTYVGVRLTLRLADGRRLPFTVTRAIGPRLFWINGLGPVE
ncbi:hypothetical protein tb265_31030 [Gemmatimonadetes bacterium T265]|nr:hypothetical protein tb265_31030 [Gemmatimonadetes bacterium T265]